MRPNYESRKICTSEQEKFLCTYTLNCAKFLYGLTSETCGKLAYEMAIINKITHPAKWDSEKMAGLEWFRGLMKMRPILSLRTPEGCSLSYRVTSFNKHNVKIFFDNLEEVFKKLPVFTDGTRIYNLDETAITTVQKPPKVVTQKGIKQVSKCTSAEKGTLVTTCCIISASGNTIPPAMVFPRVHFKDHMLRGALPGTLGLGNSSGWMTSDLFVKIMQHFIRHPNSSKETPTLLLYDNQESHLSIEVLDLGKAHGVTIVTFPYHSTNKLQPLDVAVYKPLRTYYNAAVDNWLMVNPKKTLTIYEVAPCVWEAHEKAMSPANIISAFRKTGIFPFDRDIFF